MNESVQSVQMNEPDRQAAEDHIVEKFSAYRSWKQPNPSLTLQNTDCEESDTHCIISTKLWKK